MYHGQIEGTDFVTLDKRFSGLFTGYMRVTRHWTGSIWAEGPAWFAAGRYLVWSDIPNNRMLRFVEESGQVSVFRPASNNSNGNTVDNQGRLVTCEHLTRRVTRTEFDGSVTVLADKWEGKRFNSPNDAVVKSDDSIWFTDPAYGIDGDNEGEPAKPEIDGCHVYRIDPKTGAVKRVIDDMVRPNGIIGTPDGKKLSVVDIRGRKTFAYDIAAEGTLTSPSGEQLESIAVPECRPMSASAARTRQGQEDAVHHRLHRALRGEDARPRSARSRHRLARAGAGVARCARLLRILN